MQEWPKYLDDPSSLFDPYLTRWGLTPDGDPIITASARLLPVRQANERAFLKVAIHEEEQRGGRLMLWWRGEGAVRVLAHHGPALLLERAQGSRSLADMADENDDDEATRMICGTAAKLHSRNEPPPPCLVPLTQWFAELQPAALRWGGVLDQSAAAACELLREPRDVVVLHGDLHHGNVLDAGPRGWLAIDPKGLLGERAFDFANIFCNPDKAVATASGRLSLQATVVAEAQASSAGGCCSGSWPTRVCRRPGVCKRKMKTRNWR